MARARIGLAPMVAVLGLYYVWTAFEGFRYYGMMKKRMALGLADAVVTNRFLLWALCGLVSLTWNARVGGLPDRAASTCAARCRCSRPRRAASRTRS